MCPVGTEIFKVVEKFRFLSFYELVILNLQQLNNTFKSCKSFEPLTIVLYDLRSLIGNFLDPTISTVLFLVLKGFVALFLAFLCKYFMIEPLSTSKNDNSKSLSTSGPHDNFLSMYRPGRLSP